MENVEIKFFFSFCRIVVLWALVQKRGSLYCPLAIDKLYKANWSSSSLLANKASDKKRSSILSCREIRSVG